VGAGRGDDGRREADCEWAGVEGRRPRWAHAPSLRPQGRRLRARARDASIGAYARTTEPATATELIGNALTVPEVETPLSNMEAELSSHWPDVWYVYLTAVTARRPDDEESTHGGDGKV